MTPQEKAAHARDLLRRQRTMLGFALEQLRLRGETATQLHHWIDEADRFADLAERAIYTAFHVERNSEAKP